jgi:hypothetical protein
MISRRKFFITATQGLGASLLLPSIESCNPPTFTGKIIGPNATLGHRLRTMDFAAPKETVHTHTLIIGGGVAGLSAARYLKKFTNDFLLIELEENTGGNAMAGANSISSFPWGAHYLPLPSDTDSELISFLRENEVITGDKDGLPVYNEYYLCHDPKERLYINHYWQDSLVPNEGIPEADRKQIQRFLDMMHQYRQLKGNDQRDAFAIPIEESSMDEKIISLDRITAEAFLANFNFNSPFLKWYVNYCCADDFGCTIQQTSAWAMLHYFASRKGRAANASADAVLTWPEGNYWLIKQLRKSILDHLWGNTLAYDVNVVGKNVEVLVFDAAEGVSKKIVSESVIMATPQFINNRLLKKIPRGINYQEFQYAPWMVANLTVNASLNDGRGEHLCWDNVIYGSDSLGYVNAMHQQLKVSDNERVITYYKPLLESDSTKSRNQAYAKAFKDWKMDILQVLKVPHPNIERDIREMNVWLWGHGMIKPSPGFIWGKNRVLANSPLENKIYFAHSDLGGISIFEEAFYHGHKSAKAVLRHETI